MRDKIAISRQWEHGCVVSLAGAIKTWRAGDPHTSNLTKPSASHLVFEKLPFLHPVFGKFLFHWSFSRIPCILWTHVSKILTAINSLYFSPEIDIFFFFNSERTGILANLNNRKCILLFLITQHSVLVLGNKKKMLMDVKPPPPPACVDVCGYFIAIGWLHDFPSQPSSLPGQLQLRHPLLLDSPALDSI